MGIYCQAAAAAGSLDPDKVREVLQSGRYFDTPVGPSRFWGEEYYGINSSLLLPLGPAVMEGGKAVPKVVFTVEQELEMLKVWK